MFVKRREKSLSLVVMEALACRMTLTGKALYYLHRLQKGYQAELAFDEWMEVFDDLGLVFPDLLLQPKNGNVFQLDTILLVGRVFRLYEVKGYSGEHSYGQEMWTNEVGTEIVNPIIRLIEKKNMFKKMLKDLGYGDTFHVEAHVVLVDPTCTMFHAPKNPYLLLPTQLHDHFEMLKKEVTPLSQLHRKVTKDLLANQGIPKVFWEDVPNYCMEDLRKGVCCPMCSRWELDHLRQSYRCMHCRNTGSTISLIENSISQYQALFPNMKIDNRTIHDWIGGAFSRKRVLAALKNKELYTGREASVLR